MKKKQHETKFDGIFSAKYYSFNFTTRLLSKLRQNLHKPSGHKWLELNR